MENTILRMMYLHFEVWWDCIWKKSQKKKTTETDINSMWWKVIWNWYIIND